jgi:hypothetical protein
MVEARVTEQLISGSDCSSLGIHRANNDPRDSCIEEGPCAHRTRLERDHDDDIFEPPGAKDVSCFSQDEHFSVCRGVMIGFSTISRYCEDLAVSKRDGAHGDITLEGCPACRLKGKAHGLCIA